MPLVLLLLAVVAAAILLAARGGDLPERVVATAANRLPADRREWGQALVAELVVVDGLGRRWLFALGVLRIALFPPAARRAPAGAAAAVGALATVIATAAAVRFLPTLSVFAATLGLLTSG